MTFNVRLTAYRGYFQARVLLPQFDTENAIYLISQPYEFSQVATSNGPVPVQLGPSGIVPWQDYSVVARVEVPVGDSILYEVNQPNRNVLPGLYSPSITGVQFIEWGPGWVLYFIDASFATQDLLTSESGSLLVSESGPNLIAG